MAVKTDTQATTLPAQERKLQETNDSSSRSDIPLRWVTSILLLVFPTATLFLNRGDSYVLGLLTLIGIWVWLRDGARRWLDRPSALLWIAFVLFFAVALLSYLLGTQTDAGFRFLGRYLRFLLIVPVYLALRRYPPTAKTMFIGLALGALLAGVIGGLHFYHADTVIRIEATTGLAIIFGDLATTMVLCTVAGIGLLAYSERKWVVPLLIVCVAGGVAATLLSGTRGAWTPLLLLLPVVMTRRGNYLKHRYIYMFFLVPVVVCASFYFAADVGSRARITNVGKHLSDYFVFLHYWDKPEDHAAGKQACMNDPNILKTWLAGGLIPFGPLEAQVVSDQALALETPCIGNDVILLHNPGTTTDETRIPYVVLPRYPGAPSNIQRSSIWARGTGFVTLDYRGNAEAKINSAKYRKFSVVVTDDPWGTTLNVGLGPGQTLWFVPIDSYEGEYTFPLADTSVGQRLELWRAAWTIFLSNPVLGVGTGAYQNILASLIQARGSFPFVGRYDHPHSDYFNALASAGIVGFLTLLAVLVIPFLYFWRALRNKDAATHTVGLAGALTVAGFAIYALTDTIFLHSMMITWYVIYVALFYALIQVGLGKRKKAMS